MDTYQTHDIVLASSLKINGYILEDITFSTSNKNRAFFIFEDTPELQEFVREYHLGHICVEPVQFHNEVRSLTTLIKQSLPR